MNELFLGLLLLIVNGSILIPIIIWVFNKDADEIKDKPNDYSI